MYELGVIGLGKMGEAIISGILSQGTFKGNEVCGFDISPERVDELCKRYGISACNSEKEVFDSSKVVLMAVKPQDLAMVLERLKGSSANPLVLSICAGIPISFIEGYLPDKRIVRAMPNTPALVGKGITAVSFSKACTTNDKMIAKKVFESIGEVVILPEKNMDAVTALSGSGPAYVFRFVEALKEAGIKVGLSSDVSLKLVLATIEGSVELMKKTGKSTSELVEQVASPGGTTIAGLRAMESAGFRKSIFDAVEAAFERSKELGESK